MCKTFASEQLAKPRASALEDVSQERARECMRGAVHRGRHSSARQLL